jgi:hypothetical protein
LWVVDVGEGWMNALETSVADQFVQVAKTLVGAAFVKVQFAALQLG